MKYFILTALLIAACSSPTKPPPVYTFLCLTAAGPAQFSVPSDDTKETEQYLFITQPDKEIRVDKSTCIRVEEK